MALPFLLPIWPASGVAPVGQLLRVSILPAETIILS